jgi:hypothetical protein
MLGKLIRGHLRLTNPSEEEEAAAAGQLLISHRV